jgi:hypothetical protein
MVATCTSRFREDIVTTLEQYFIYLLGVVGHTDYTERGGGGEQCRALFPKTSPSQNSLVSNHHLLITYCCHL